MVMKTIKLTSLLETTFGPIEVSTFTVPWWFTTLSFGLFRKIESHLSGPGLQREEVLRREWTERFHWQNPPHDKLAKTQIFCTVPCRIKFWHKHAREYAKAMAGILTGYHAMMQLHCQLQEAEESYDFERVLRIRREIREHKKRQDRKWQEFPDQ